MARNDEIIVNDPRVKTSTTRKEKRTQKTFTPSEVEQIMQFVRSQEAVTPAQLQQAQAQPQVQQPIAQPQAQQTIAAQPVDPVANRGGASIRATPGINVTSNRPDVPVQQIGQPAPFQQQSPALNQLHQGLTQQPNYFSPTAQPQNMNANPQFSNIDTGVKEDPNYKPHGWFKGLFKGQPERFTQYPIYNAEQQNLQNRLANQGYAEYSDQGDFSGIQAILSDLMQRNHPNNFNFEPFREQAFKDFNETTLPSIYERFTSMGKGAQSTGAFQGMQARGAADLGLGLSQQEQLYNMQNRGLNQNQQQLTQGLLDQQQRYQLGKRGMGLNALQPKLAPQYENNFQKSTPGAAGPLAKEAVKAGSQAATMALLL